MSLLREKEASEMISFILSFISRHLNSLEGSLQHE